jgi:formate-dependent nitrite reductase membrane component NrfD
MYEKQHAWETLVSLDMYLGGTGAGAFFISYIMYYIDVLRDIFVYGLIIGPLLTLLGLMILFIEVGNPSNAPKIMSNIRSSWISRGGIIQPLFVLIGILYGLLLDRYISTTIIMSRLLLNLLGISAFILSILICLYHGLVLNQSKSIPLWASSITPIIYFITSISSGMGIVLMMFGIYSLINIVTLIPTRTILLISYSGMIIVFSLIVSVISLVNSSLNEEYRISIAEMKNVLLISIIFLFVVLTLFYTLSLSPNIFLTMFSYVFNGIIMMFTGYIIRASILRNAYKVSYLI